MRREQRDRRVQLHQDGAVRFIADRNRTWRNSIPNASPAKWRDREPNRAIRPDFSVPPSSKPRSSRSRGVSRTPGIRTLVSQSWTVLEDREAPVGPPVEGTSHASARRAGRLNRMARKIATRSAESLRPPALRSAWSPQILDSFSAMIRTALRSCCNLAAAAGKRRLGGLEFGSAPCRPSGPRDGSRGDPTPFFGGYRGEVRRFSSAATRSGSAGAPQRLRSGSMVATAGTRWTTGPSADSHRRLPSWVPPTSVGGHESVSS